MPQISANHTIDVTPEKYINACSCEELIELQLILDSPRVKERLRLHHSQLDIFSVIDEVSKETGRKYKKLIQNQ